ncbi:MAG TPA: hypothetical protein VE775_06100, partial [Pyrinomonadaceae bacterium]|nr:hypothetical protein [Pyrinomonadaceae bacterium]
MCAALLLGALLICTGSAPSTFAQARTPPAPVPDDLAPTEIPALIREVARSEHAMQPRRFEYTWTTKITDREVNKRGEVT